MRSKEFVKALIEAGWKDTCDAQHTQIYELWARIFPCIADLENEVAGLEEDLEDAILYSK